MSLDGKYPYQIIFYPKITKINAVTNSKVSKHIFLPPSILNSNLEKVIPN